MVLVCRDPSRVTWHLVVKKGNLKSISLNCDLQVWLLVESFLAEAVEMSAPRMTVVLAVASSILKSFI
jgi:hypothetical protein